jgi:hypothetical protein
MCCLRKDCTKLCFFVKNLERSFIMREVPLFCSKNVVFRLCWRFPVSLACYGVSVTIYFVISEVLTDLSLTLLPTGMLRHAI